MNISINTSLQKPNTSLTQFQLNELESMLEKESNIETVMRTLLKHTTCEYATFELERLLPLLGKARSSQICGIVKRVLFQSVCL